MKIPVYNREGKTVGEATLPREVFAVPIRPALVQQAVVAHFAGRRRPIAHTKTRAEVRGGGRKPWRQKGTGRARHGSIRSPLWKGGGVTFGPRNTRQFAVRLNTKARRAAIRMALSDRVASGRLIVLDSLDLPRPKTREFINLFKNLPFAAGKKLPSALVVMPEASATLDRATRNLPGVETIRADSLNVAAVVGHDYLVLPAASLDHLRKRFGAPGTAGG